LTLGSFEAWLLWATMPLMENFKVRDGIWFSAMVVMGLLWYADRQLLKREIIALNRRVQVQEVTTQNALRRVAELINGK
jgi:hypothetical protein